MLPYDPEAGGRWQPRSSSATPRTARCGPCGRASGRAHRGRADTARALGDHHGGTGRIDERGPQPHPNQDRGGTWRWNPGRGRGIRPTRDRRSSPRAQAMHLPISPPRHRARRHGRPEATPDDHARALGADLAKPSRRSHPVRRRRPRRSRQLHTTGTVTFYKRDLGVGEPQLRTRVWALIADDHPPAIGPSSTIRRSGLAWSPTDPDLDSSADGKRCEG